jgi:hypothetical protein
MTQRGRASIFRDKEGGTRVQGLLTAEGFVCFGERREELRRLTAEVVGKDPGQVSDADVIEYLARGVHATTAALLRR